MSFVKDTFLGGAERRAGRIQAQAARDAQALTREATTGATGALREQSGLAEGALTESLQQQLGFLDTGQQDALSQLFGFGERGFDVLGLGGQAAQDAINQQFGQATGQLQPFAEGGGQAFQQQLALSGALGPEAAQQAFANFQASPGQDFLQEAGARQVNRAASAGGGLQSGSVLAELQRQGQGLAQQDFQNQFNRLGQLGQQGQQASGNIAQLLAQQGGSLANILQGTSGSQANLLNQLGGGAANLISSLATQRAAAAGGSGTQLANLRQTLGSNLANALLGQGTQLSGLEQDFGAGIASGVLGQAAQGRAFEEQQFDRGPEGVLGGLFSGGLGGIGENISGAIGSIFSDKNLKDSVEELDGEQAFEIVMNLDIKKWRYIKAAKVDRDIHFGPMAQDAPDCITDRTKRLINVHDETMLVAKAMQFASKNRFRVLELINKWEAA